MKKILVAILGVLLFTGCTDMMNTPTKRVEEFLGKYQTMDSEVLKQLDEVIEKEETMTKDQRKEYRDLIKKQYQNLSYKIKDETVNGDEATVEVEIEVFDYQKAISDAEKYLDEHKDEFKKETKTAQSRTTEDNDDRTKTQNGNKEETEKDTTRKDTTLDTIDHEKFMDYKIKQLKDVKDKVKHTLTLTLTKKDKKWVLDDVSETDRLKIHGLYNY